jgi:polysaccharide chain length determinant protein (PEP-CTERM system associated)
MLVPAVLGCVAVFGVALYLPSRYTSQSLILIEGQRVPDAFVQSAVTEDLNARLATMQEQILSRTRLQAIIERYGLFKRDMKGVPLEELARRLRQAIDLTAIKPIVSSRTRDQVLPGFNISVTLEAPQVAQQVCTEISSMFIEENLRQRERASQGTTDFLQGQLDNAKRSLDEQDAKLATFKQKYMGMLPDEMQTNLNLLSTLNTQLEAVTQALNRAQQDKTYTESLLAQQVSAWEQMNAMKDGIAPPQDTLEQQLADLQNRMLAAEARYTSQHPDVIKLKAVMEELRKKIREREADAGKESSRKSSLSLMTEPPQIRQLRSQLHMDEEAIRANSAEQERLKQRIKLFESRLQLSPVVEQEFKKSTRDHETALQLYNDLLRKKDQSSMATDLERKQQGEQFRIMDPPSLPEKPTFPNRPLFALAGFGGGLALGVGLAFLCEMQDKAIRNEHDVKFFLGTLPVARIPLVEATGSSRSEARSRSRVTRKEHERAGA